MPIFLITRTDDVDYDEYSGFVVDAPNETAAREIAFEAANAGGSAFLREEITTIVCVGTSIPGAEARVILGDFKNG